MERNVADRSAYRRHLEQRRDVLIIAPAPSLVVIFPDFPLSLGVETLPPLRNVSRPAWIAALGHRMTLLGNSLMISPLLTLTPL